MNLETGGRQKDIELCLVMRHVWPVLAGATERFRRYAPGLRTRGVRMSAVARLPEGELPLRELAPGGVDIMRVAGAGAEVHAWDVKLYERLAQHRAEHPSQPMILQTNVAFKHTRAQIQSLRASGMPAVWLGSMMEDATVGMPWWRRQRERLRLRMMFGVFDAFTVGSSVMRDWLRDAWVPERRIHVIGHGVDHARFHPVLSSDAKSALRRDLGLPGEAVIVLMVGTITARKGVHLLLEAWEKYLAAEPRAHLILAGGFDRPTVVHGQQQRDLATYQEGIHRQLAALQSTGRVRHVGEVSAIPDWMRACDALVLPSEREGVPNVVLEAMSCGLPCLLTPFAGLPREELGAEGSHWLLAARNVDALGAALSTLIRDDARREAIGHAAGTHAAARFGLEQTLDGYSALYHQLLR